MKKSKSDIPSIRREYKDIENEAHSKETKPTGSLSYSVLMSVYGKVSPEHLRHAVQSMLAQTVKTDDFILVCDGPLTKALNEVVEQFERQEASIFHVVRLKENVGIGASTNIGLAHCKHELVAKMDSDNVAMPNRCELQLKKFMENDQLAVLGGQLLEFWKFENNIVALKKVPTKYDKIMRYVRRRDPFNNQTVMYKRSAVMQSGGYRQLSRCEDYDLFIRMLRSGNYCENLGESLVKYRLDENTFKRRKSKENLYGFISVRWRMHKSGLSSFIDFLVPVLAQIIISILPIRAQKMVYIKILRRRP